MKKFVFISKDNTHDPNLLDICPVYYTIMSLLSAIWIQTSRTALFDVVDENNALFFKINGVPRFVWLFLPSAEADTSSAHERIVFEITHPHTEQIYIYTNLDHEQSFISSSQFGLSDEIRRKINHVHNFGNLKNIIGTTTEIVRDVFQLFLSEPDVYISKAIQKHISHSSAESSEFTPHMSALFEQLKTALIPWNSKFEQFGKNAQRLQIVDQHIKFICIELFSFFNTTKIRPDQSKGYSRYRSKHFWHAADMPEGLRERSLLFFKFPHSADLHVLVKSDVQVSTMHAHKELEQLYGRGNTKFIKCHQILLTFTSHSDSELTLSCINPVVTCSRISHPEFILVRRHIFELATSQSVMIEDKKSNLSQYSYKMREFLTNLTNDRPENIEFSGWKKIIFKDKNDKISQIYYQINKGQKIAGFPISYCVSIKQKLHACLTFLKSVKNLLKEGYWPIDLQIANMCLQLKSSPLSSTQMPCLHIIDPTSFTGSAYSLYKTPLIQSTFNPTQHFQHAITLNVFVTYLAELNARTPQSRILDRRFARMIQQLLFEIATILIELFHQKFIVQMCGARYDQHLVKPECNLLIPTISGQHTRFINLLTSSMYGYIPAESINTQFLKHFFFQTLHDYILNIYASIPDAERMQNIQIDPDLSDIYNDVCNDGCDEFCQSIVNFRSTRSPFTTDNATFTTI